METSGKHVDRESQVYERLTGVKKHFCPDWDYMAIDENCPEFEACTCEDLPEREFRWLGVGISFGLVVWILVIGFIVFAAGLFG